MCLQKRLHMFTMKIKIYLNYTIRNKILTWVKMITAFIFNMHLQVWDKINWLIFYRRVCKKICDTIEISCNTIKIHHNLLITLAMGSWDIIAYLKRFLNMLNMFYWQSESLCDFSLDHILESQSSGKFIRMELGYKHQSQ